MTDEKMPQPLNKPRRQDVAKDDKWIREFLHRAPYGVLGTEWQGQPFVKPTLYVYNEESNALYFHGALEGRTRVNIETNQRVSFCVAEMERLLPADTAMEFGVEYSSVVVFGRGEVVTDESEAEHGLQMLLDKYFPRMVPKEDYRPITTEEVDITTVYRIDIEQWSGKEQLADVDYPNAFYYV
jgi:nitroimidazol reductase NimA-like FMN-containing flavoprotein (pyridoxamine 5'-phosphate oxidase superfamily)